jgi:hypothetical protein
MNTLASQMTRYNGRRYRVCVYSTYDTASPIATATSWVGFVESPRYYLGGTGCHGSRRAALIAAARIVATDASGVTL